MKTLLQAPSSKLQALTLVLTLAAGPLTAGPPTADDSDGDGIPNIWETNHSHNPNDPADGDSDFDFDGLTAGQEYSLSVTSGGLYGKPLGKYKLTQLAAPSEYASIASISMVEAASNGILLVKIKGQLNGETTSSDRAYTWSPATATWTHILPPPDVPATTMLTVTDVSTRGEVAGYCNGGGSRGFIWTPDASNPGAGESKRFFVNPDSASPIPAWPRRIGSSGSLLYSSVSGSGPLLPADRWHDAIEPVDGLWTSVRYCDVNDFGEYVGEVYDPITSDTRTFLSVPNGPFFLSALSYHRVHEFDPMFGVPLEDDGSLQWDYLPFPPPAPPTLQYQAPDGTAFDPYEGHAYARGTDWETGLDILYRKDFLPNGAESGGWWRYFQPGTTTRIKQAARTSNGMSHGIFFVTNPTAPAVRGGAGPQQQ